MQLDKDLRTGHGQAFSRPDIEGHASPPPRIDLQLERSKRLHLRGWGDPVFAPIAAELPADNIPRLQWADGPQDLDFFVPYGFAIGSHWRLHRQVGQNLEQMVLHDVADRARLIIKRAPPLDAEVFGHGDLHTRDMVAIPERLQERIGKAEEEHVVHWQLAQVMVDAEDRFLVEGAEQRAVERLRRAEIVPERFFNDDARAVRAFSFAQLVHNRLEQAGRDGEIVRRLLRRAKLLTEGLKRCRVLIVAVHIAQQTTQFFESGGINPAVVFNAVMRSRPELLEIPTS